MAAVLHLLAGPNGSGKSTYVDRVLQPITRLPFINADVIAAELWPDSQAAHAYEAAQIAEGRRREAMASHTSFITETVFSHPSKIQLLADASAHGYLVHLHVMVVPVELTIRRVAERVRRGGHAVPETKIRDRYDRLWNHVCATVSFVDEATFYDNSRASEPFRTCATFNRGRLVGEATWPTWAPSALGLLGVAER